jgi:hypothetical protein
VEAENVEVTLTNEDLNLLIIHSFRSGYLSGAAQEDPDSALYEVTNHYKPFINLLKK